MAAIWNRINTLLLILVLLTLLAVVGLLANGARGGSLDPDDPPASTMKSLDDIPGSWNRVYAADDGAPMGTDPPTGCNSSRFECLEDWFYQVVLDRETGLVWERDATQSGATTWELALRHCGTITVDTVQGTRRGFRVPTFEELQTLVRTAVPTPLLPPGHPFSVNTDDNYWTSTTTSTGAARAWSFVSGLTDEAKTAANTNYVWCVRGGQAYDGM